MKPLREAICDKGYHGGECLVKLQEEHHIRTYVSEPKRGRRKWDDKRDQHDFKQPWQINCARKWPIRNKLGFS